MTKTQKREAWIAIRERGLLRFVLLNGILKWGLPAAALWSLVVLLVGDGSGLDVDVGTSIGMAFVIFPALGVVFGALLWMILDRKYRPRRSLRT